MHAGAVSDLLHRQFLAGLIDDDDRHVAASGDHVPLAVLGDVTVAQLDQAVEVAFDKRLVDVLGDAADVEGAHGELRARLADRLSGDGADSLAEVDGRAAGEIAPVALGADAVGGFARQHRADAHFLDLRRFEQRGVPPRSGGRPE